MREKVDRVSRNCAAQMYHPFHYITSFQLDEEDEEEEDFLEGLNITVNNFDTCEVSCHFQNTIFTSTISGFESLGCGTTIKISTVSRRNSKEYGSDCNGFTGTG